MAKNKSKENKEMIDNVSFVLPPPPNNYIGIT